MNADAPASLDILWEDSHLLIVNKPAGVPSQHVRGIADSVESRVRSYLSATDSGSVFLGAVHRLDRPVSGVLAWAKTQKAARRLARDFEHRALRKEYWAIVPASESIAELWDDWLTPLDDSGVAHVVEPETGRAKQAITRVSRLKSTRLPVGFQSLELLPATGRTHQLRAQAAVREMAIVGDARYGSTASFPEGIALHARALTFAHPTTQTELRITAPVPRSWIEFGFDAAGVR